MPRRRGFVLTCLLFLGVATMVGATTVLRMTLDDLADRSEWVAQGVVDRVEARVVPGMPPFRLARLRVLETIAGHGPAVAWIRLPGGPDERGMVARVAGVPELAAGDEIVVFLDRVPAAALQRATVAPIQEDASRSRAERIGGPQPVEQWVPVGLAMGTWNVERGGPHPRVARHREAAGLHQVGPQPGPPAPVELPLEELASRVRARRAGASR